MIHVIATVTLREGCRKKYLEIFKKLVPMVQAEDGCLAYGPTEDVDTGIPIQGPVRKDVVTIVEAWESLDHLNAHLATKHMTDYRKQTGSMVKGVALQVLKPV